MTGRGLPGTTGRRRWLPLAVTLLGGVLVAVAWWRRPADSSGGDANTLLLVGLLVARSVRCSRFVSCARSPGTARTSRAPTTRRCRYGLCRGGVHRSVAAASGNRAESAHRQRADLPPRLVVSKSLTRPEGGVALATHLLKHCVEGFNRSPRLRGKPPGVNPLLHQQTAVIELMPEFTDVPGCDRSQRVEPCLLLLGCRRQDGQGTNPSGEPARMRGVLHPASVEGRRGFRRTVAMRALANCRSVLLCGAQMCRSASLPAKSGACWAVWLTSNGRLSARRPPQPEGAQS